jgi:isoquinoline 1-oxidoreductase beta subunit
VGSTHTAYSTEAFVDELAVAAGKDPVEFRRAMLAKHPRHLAALELAADKSGWSRPLAAAAAGEKRGRGVAVHESFGTVVAQVAEVTVDKDSKIKVDRVVCAVDCGIAVNPDVSGADGRRDRLRAVGGAVRQDHVEGRRRRAIQLPRLSGAADQ